MLHADQDGEKVQALLRLLTELLERVRVVDALSNVPQMYCLAVAEVVRRKMFMRHYREVRVPVPVPVPRGRIHCPAWCQLSLKMSAVSPQWAYSLVKDGKLLYDAEKLKRESFGKLFRENSSLFLVCFFPGSLAHPVCVLSGKSFLRNRLFKGLDSWPPRAFCVSCCHLSVSRSPLCFNGVFFCFFFTGCLQTQKPRRFDDELPDISVEDLQYLKSCCPLEVQPFLM